MKGKAQHHHDEAVSILQVCVVGVLVQAVVDVVVGKIHESEQRQQSERVKAEHSEFVTVSVPVLFVVVVLSLLLSV